MFSESPFGQDVSDMVVARMGAALWNQQRGKNAEPIEAKDFLPHKQQSVEEMKLMLRRHLIGSR